MPNKIVLKKSAVAAKVPLTGDIDFGELALNYADGKLYYKTSAGAIDSFSSGAASVTSVAGKTGAVTLVKADVGLGSVDNTSDSAKNVLSATKLTTARTIGGVSFDGSANISLPGVNTAGTQSTTGNAATSDTTKDVASGTGIGDLNTSWTLPGSSIANGFRVYNFQSSALNAHPAKIDNANWLVNVYSHGSGGVASYGHQLSAGGTDDLYTRKVTNGSFSSWRKLISDGNINSHAPTLTGTGASGTWGISVTGNAATATALQTARTINGVSFNGSANITVADSTKLPLAGGTMTGAIAFAAGQTWPTFNQSTTGSAAALTTGRTIAMTGDVAWTSALFNGSANVTGTATLANSGVTAGSYSIPNITIDSKGRITAAVNGSSVAISDTAPTSPTPGSLWWDSTIGQLRVFYNDGDSTQWVDAVNTQSINGVNGINGTTILSGTTNPTIQGVDGDFYINTATSVIFGPKSSGVWPAGVTLKGTDGLGVPTGGTAGQALVKNSATNNDTSWATLVSGEVGTKTTVLSSGSGTFIRDPKLLFAEVYCTGGGGGGGGSDSDGTSMSASGGGGGGGTAIIRYSVSQMGETAAYSVGAAGTAGSLSGSNGGTGGTSSFDPAGSGVTITGTGGVGGTGTGSGYANYNSAFNGGVGGAGTGGSIIANGVEGSPGFGYGTSTTVGSMMAGNGGSSFWGGGGNGPTRNNASGSQAGADATTEGAGGSGAVNNNNTAGVIGGAGAPGVIKIVEYLSV